ncbi:Ribosomal RNA large subunit methyltransferase K/L [Aquicella siphonis]|uniref:Ribosomal RNA large subunit methyltransferase K/L n=1 Tax=Aquicella siphonis TaxID=254247 RepID=A0A5E4PJ85_9COXI|nr:bifunctional 23S rRNA (guanine(2069)-N(7))-methyltransferase RlmK/23S rRNA (guanine(2445)-N(2))-methyltransferase RlmL [Aquicella siphonis]VVC76442.1 Ribosomal RNA large subunit methyltransferase K/L [Aquicella siphonis]
MTSANTLPYRLFATTPKGLELLLVEELRTLGANNAAEKLAGVAFSGDLQLAYRVCLWSRLANRILLSLTKVPASSPDELYAGVRTIDWSEHINPHGTLAVQFVASQSNMTHTLFGAQKVKDAIVDQLREKFGVRPDISRERPDVCVYVYLHRNEAEISLDLSGESLHRRGYRLVSGSAPLKENLAAAILLRAGWPEIAKNGGALLDPMCGSGTLLIEAAQMAADTAPGLGREYFGFLGWKKHRKAVWETIWADAENRKAAGMKRLPEIAGYDHDPISIRIAFENIERAGLLGKVHVERRELSVFAPEPQFKPGLVVANPPYGERLGDRETLQPLYQLLAERLKLCFTGWKAAVFTGNPELGKQMGLRAKRYYALFNGPIPCKLLLFDVLPAYFIDRSPAADNERRVRAAQKAVSGQDPQAAQMFINRLRKNLKHLKRQAARRGETSYRVYDADLPEYAFVIDITEAGVMVGEYEAPKTIPEDKVLRRRNEILAVLPEILEIAPARIFFNVIPRPR